MGTVLYVGKAENLRMQIAMIIGMYGCNTTVYDYIQQKKAQEVA